MQRKVYNVLYTHRDLQKKNIDEKEYIKRKWKRLSMDEKYVMLPFFLFFFFALFYSIPNLSYFNCIFTMEQSSSFFNDPFSFTCFLCCIVDSLFFLSQLLFYNFIPSFFFCSFSAFQSYPINWFPFF